MTLLDTLSTMKSDDFTGHIVDGDKSDDFTGHIVDDEK